MYQQSRTTSLYSSILMIKF